jgi:hypothetical protein
VLNQSCDKVGKQAKDDHGQQMYTGHQGRIPKLGLKIQSNPETHYRKTYKAHAQNEE